MSNGDNGDKGREPDAVAHANGGVTVKTSLLAGQVYLDPSESYSVCGYAERSRQCFGEIYLGLDKGPEYYRQSTQVNAAIQLVTRAEAFALSLDATRKALAGAPPDDKALIVKVLASLCRVWFNVPDDKNVLEVGIGPAFSPPHCPGSYMLPSAYIFGPDPDATLSQLGPGFGQALKPAVETLVREHLDAGTKPSGALSSAVFEAFPDGDCDLIARTLSGIMMGMIPTVFVNLQNVLTGWLPEQRATLRSTLERHCGSDPYVRARDVLLKPLMQQIQADPVPEAVWRTATRAHTVGTVTPVRVASGDKVRVDIVAATRGDLAAGITDVLTVFGGSRRATPHPQHACPGYAMAMGIMLGFVNAVIEVHGTGPAAQP